MTVDIKRAKLGEREIKQIEPGEREFKQVEPGERGFKRVEPGKRNSSAFPSTPAHPDFPISLFFLFSPISRRFTTVGTSPQERIFIVIICLSDEFQFSRCKQWNKVTYLPLLLRSAHLSEIALLVLLYRDLEWNCHFLP